jgi:hypothetical protein
MAVHKAIQAMQVFPPGECERCAGAAVGGAPGAFRENTSESEPLRIPRMDYSSPSRAAGSLGFCGTGGCGSPWPA